MDKQNKNKQNLTNNMGGIKYIKGESLIKSLALFYSRWNFWLFFFRFLFILSFFLIWNFQYEDGGARKSTDMWVSIP